MNLADVMQEIADRLDSISGLRVYAHPPDNIQPPAAVVSYPESYTYDETYGRGMDVISDLPVILLVGRVSARESRNQIGAYADGSGPRSIKQVIESGSHSAFDDVRVSAAMFDIIKVADVEYVGATFTLDLAGPGS